jgi:peptidoglycan/xylan/chitin deacetylase (PgdA/CDA1 family)
VRALDLEGFEVGAHTVNHIDMGKVDRSTAEQEVNESKHRLEAELAKPVPLFAYPYGGLAQMNEENREVVRAAGFRCCLSAYGGDVVPGDDPFYVMRQPISPWYLSPYQFGFEVAVSKPARPT